MIVYNEYYSIYDVQRYSIFNRQTSIPAPLESALNRTSLQVFYVYFACAFSHVGKSHIFSWKSIQNGTSLLNKLKLELFI